MYNYVYSSFFLIVLLFSLEAVYVESLKVAAFTPVFCELHTACTVLFICVFMRLYYIEVLIPGRV